MKELTIEEKARRYDEALATTRKLYNMRGDWTNLEIESIFPELAESEDDKIRKEIILALKFANVKGVYNKHISWLEKQGEHAKFRDSIQVGDKVTRNEDGVLVNMSQLNRVAKPADKIEPRFKKGDWVVDKQGIVHQIANVIENVTNHTYGYDIVGGGYFNDNTEGVRLWTLQDAKEGDLIYVSTEVKGIQAIFHKFENGIIYFHCNLCGDFTQCGYMPIGSIELVCPLQKTQHKSFFEKMKEAGYKWDVEKKELKKIEPKPADWSEEDEDYINDLIKHFSQNERLKNTKEDIVIRLKSLKLKKQWKPSKEQMEALWNVYEGGEKQSALASLYNDLKKL